MRENMELLIKKLNKACLIYKKDFLNKDFLVIARKRKNTEIIEINFRKEHFMHLVGIKGMKANDFFEKISLNILSVNELNKLKKNPYINQKLNSFPKLRRLFEEEPYLYNFHPHSTTKVELDKIIANINREIKKELIGLKFLKTLSKKSYIPASIEDRKASEITAEERKRIICILEKKSSEKDYSKILFRNLEENLSLYIPKEVFISIKKELEKVNYNCLTGEPINIENYFRFKNNKRNRAKVCTNERERKVTRN